MFSFNEFMSVLTEAKVDLSGLARPPRSTKANITANPQPSKPQGTKVNLGNLGKPPGSVKADVDEPVQDDDAPVDWDKVMRREKGSTRGLPDWIKRGLRGEIDERMPKWVKDKITGKGRKVYAGKTPQEFLDAEFQHYADEFIKSQISNRFDDEVPELDDSEIEALQQGALEYAQRRQRERLKFDRKVRAAQKADREAEGETPEAGTETDDITAAIAKKLRYGGLDPEEEKIGKTAFYINLLLYGDAQDAREYPFLKGKIAPLGFLQGQDDVPLDRLYKYVQHEFKKRGLDTNAIDVIAALERLKKASVQGRGVEEYQQNPDGTWNFGKNPNAEAEEKAVQDDAEQRRKRIQGRPASDEEYAAHKEKLRRAQGQWTPQEKLKLDARARANAVAYIKQMTALLGSKLKQFVAEYGRFKGLGPGPEQLQQARKLIELWTHKDVGGTPGVTWTSMGKNKDGEDDQGIWTILHTGRGTIDVTKHGIKPLWDYLQQSIPLMNALFKDADSEVAPEPEVQAQRRAPEPYTVPEPKKGGYGVPGAKDYRYSLGGRVTSQPAEKQPSPEAEKSAKKKRWFGVGAFKDLLPGRRTTKANLGESIKADLGIGQAKANPQPTAESDPRGELATDVAKAWKRLLDLEPHVRKVQDVVERAKKVIQDAAGQDDPMRSYKPGRRTPQKPLGDRFKVALGGGGEATPQAPQAPQAATQKVNIGNAAAPAKAPQPQAAPTPPVQKPQKAPQKPKGGGLMGMFEYTNDSDALMTRLAEQTKQRLRERLQEIMCRS